MADALSRAPATASLSALVNLVPAPSSVNSPSREEFVLEQSKCNEVQQLALSAKLKVTNEDGLLVSYATGGRRVLVPVSLRHRVIDSVHALHHPGIRATGRLLARSFIWNRMRADAAAYVRGCIPCGKSKVHQHLRPPPAVFPKDVRRFETVHLDLVGPLDTVDGYRYLLTMVDRSSRWLEAVPLRSITAEEVATSFLNTWVSRYGVPRQLVTDRGTQFQSSLFSEICRYLGVGHSPTTSYHPEAKGKRQAHL